jgi:hypothetical protein
MPATKTVRVTLDLSTAEAFAFAQFVKRSVFETYREFSVDEDEAHLMLDAVEKLRAALAEKGIAPR